MAHTFAELDGYFWQVARTPEESSPDSALDSIFMMHEDDWALLRHALRDRPPAWRAECAYILGHGPFEECLPMLLELLFDPDLNVASEAGSSYSAQVLEHQPRVPPDPEAVLRLGVIVNENKGHHVSEIQELLRYWALP